MIPFLFFSFKRAWQGFWRNALMSLAATATMVLMLLLLAGFWIIQTGLLASLDFTEQKVEVVADIFDNVTPTQVEEVRQRVLQMPEVAEVTYVSREEALARFRDRVQQQGEVDLTKALESNPLHASLEIKLLNVDGFDDVVAMLREEPIIEKVKEQQKLVDQLLTVTNVLRTAGTVVLLVVGIIALFIIVNTIRLAVFARADEIEIMRLVGASDAFIRWPFVFEGAFVGFLGAVLTLVTLALTAEPINDFMLAFFQVLPIEVGSMTRDLVTLVMGAGVGLGILGSWVSVRTYLIR